MIRFSTGLILIMIGFFPFGIEAESGIDWEASYMMVEFTEENTAVPTLDCFGYSDRSTDPGACSSYGGTYSGCVWEDLDTLGYSDENDSPEITNCYQQAGDYQVTVQLVDFAGNNSTPIVNNLVVKAGTPDANTSTLIADADCSDLSLGATGGVAGTADNICSMILEIKDEFGNPVTQLQSQIGKIYSEAEFPSDANTGSLTFRTGTKISEASLGVSAIPNTEATALSYTIGSDDEVSNTFSVGSWAPTIRREGDYLGVNEPFSYDLKFVLPTIDTLGNLDTSNTVTFEYDQYTPQIGFAPWARILLDITAIPKQYLLDINTPFEIARNLLLPTSGGPNNPFNVFITLHDLDSTLQINGINYDPIAEVVDSATETLISVLRVAGDNAQTGGSIAFSSRIEYDITDGSTYTIAYPSGYLGLGLGVGDDGNENDITTSLIGVSVEGKILGSKDAIVINDPSSFNGVQISEGESLTDIRKEIFENAIRITRSLSETDPDPGDPNSLIDFDTSWFANANVVYVSDKDVAITNSGATLNMPAGQKTLVIQNGNLIIEDDLAYASNLDSFGFILINDSIEIEPATGNIFVKDDVSEIVGTYFAEGGLMSIPESLILVETGDVELSDSDNADGSNAQQLIIEGTMLTHNTLGGGIYQAASDTYITPWEVLPAAIAGNQERAQRYDLHYLRAYGPEFDAGDPPNQTNTADCFPGDNTYGCYPNNAATVIRYDGKAVKSPPPGYEGASFFAR